MKKCHKVRHLLALRPADRNADEQKLVEAHLSACPACAALVHEYADQDRLIRGLPRIRFTPLQRSQLLARAQDEQQAKSNANPILLLRTAATAIVILIALGVGLRFLIPQQTAPPRVTAPPAQSPQTTTQPSPSLPPTIHSSTPSSPETTALPSPTRAVPPTVTPQPPKPTATPVPQTATFPPPSTSTPPPPPTKEPPTAHPTKRPSPTPLPPPTVTPAPPTPTATATPTSTPSPTQTITPTVTVEPTVVTTDTSGTEMLIAVQAGQGENPSATHVQSPVFCPVGTDLEASIDGMIRESKPRHDTKYCARAKEVDRDEYILG